VAQSSGAAIAYRLTYRRADLVKGLISIDGGPAESAGTPGLRHALRFGGFLTKLFVGSGTLRSKVRHDLIENSGDTSWVTDSVVYEYTAGQAADVHGAIDALRKISKSHEPESLRVRLHESSVPVHGSGQYVHEEQPDAVIAAVEQMSAPPPVVLDPPVNAVAAP
jgi:hypothetical protein